MSFSPALLFYRAATTLVGPFAGAWLNARARNGKEDEDRIGERFGRYTQARPEGTLVWLHAASVGESGVALARRWRDGQGDDREAGRCGRRV